MNHTLTLIENNVLPLPEPLVTELGWTVGDILIFKRNENGLGISIEKHADQTLSDEQISRADNLGRVFELKTDE